MASGIEHVHVYDRTLFRCASTRGVQGVGGNHVPTLVGLSPGAQNIGPRNSSKDFFGK